MSGPRPPGSPAVVEAPVRVPVGEQPVVVVVELVVPFPAERAQPLRLEVLAQAQGLEPVLGVDRREMGLADQRRLVAGPPQLVGDRPEPLPQRRAVLLGRDAVGLDARS